MAKRASVVGVDRAASGEVVCGATTRKKNGVWVGDGRGWRSVAEWGGKEITGCCACGPDFVCPALDGVLYVVTAEGEVRTMPLSEPDTWFYGCGRLDEDRALMAGTTGRLAVYDRRTGGVERERLLGYGVDKPGRTIHEVSRYGGRVFLTGAKNLVLEYRESGPVELANKATFGGRELFFHGAVAQGGRIWLAAAWGVLAAIADPGPAGDGGGLAREGSIWEESCWSRTSSIRIRPYGDELMVFQNSVFVGVPGAWRPLIEGFEYGVGLAGVEESPVAGEMIAVGYDGQAFALGGGAARPVPVF